jgi:hypothetical protein
MDPDPDATPDPTLFFSDFQDAKKFIFFLFFTNNLPAGTLSSVLKHYFSPLNTFMRKGKDPDPDPHL